MLALDAAQVLGEQRQRAELLERDETGAQAVIDVVIVVGDLVGDVRELRLETGLFALEEPFANVAELACMLERAVLQDALASLERQVQTAERRVAVLEVIDDAQRLQVVLEAPEVAHTFVERILAGVAERRVAEIVRETDRLDEVLV